MFSMGMDYIWNRPQHFKRKAAVAKDERDITNHIVIITGCNHGIGKQTALELAKRGAQVVMACRDLSKAEGAKEDILKEVPQGKLEIMKLDLGDMQGVREFSSAVHERFDHIDMLINNAAVYVFKDGKVEKTKDGFEQHIGVNYLNTFLLTLLLLDLLKKAERSRIVNVSSMMHQIAELDVDNLSFDLKPPNNKNIPYANSKRAIILFTRELTRRLGQDSNINVYALCPGGVYTDNLDDQSFLKRQKVKFMMSFALLDVKDGCLTTLHCALSKSLENESGKMYRLLDAWDVEKMMDDQLSVKLWEKAEELVGIKFTKP